MMLERVIQGFLVSAGLIVAGYLFGGRYSFIALTDDGVDIAWRLDRYTGKVSYCAVGVTDKGSFAMCRPITEKDTPVPYNITN